MIPVFEDVAKVASKAETRQELHATPGEEALETFTPGHGSVPHSSGNMGQID
ncbi:hypothetical protein [Endozoicomonas sp. SESOKO2]|uniref:hypothetical protein n=1 Tax=Endozoicomonas sp. SESOKO2 TaxID=2828743 RepID=UPI002149585D|nr:hypothetical protein [Endozoicomonas sp. SESOKO2]